MDTKNYYLDFKGDSFSKRSLVSMFDFQGVYFCLNITFEPIFDMICGVLCIIFFQIATCWMTRADIPRNEPLEVSGGNAVSFGNFLGRPVDI